LKLILTFVVFLALIGNSYAQAPQGIPYQAVARNSGGAILASTIVGVRFTIRDSVTSGTIIYRETHNVTTTAQGMFSVNVGQGTPVSGTFTSIKWGTNAKFLQVEIDPAGGSSYTDMGTQQMMSVPYALNAGALKLTVSATGDTLYSGGGNSVIVPGISAANTPPLTIGMSYGGGKIAYIYLPGDPGYIAGETHGIIAASSDLGNYPWGCNTTVVGGTSVSLGTGAANTSIISVACGAGTAARVCSDLVIGSYSDWYLPSFFELAKLYESKAMIGGFENSYYWSSSEGSPEVAGFVYFFSGSGGSNTKSASSLVRAVRSF
jgi:hypothetical protein